MVRIEKLVIAARCARVNGSPDVTNQPLRIRQFVRFAGVNNKRVVPASDVNQIEVTLLNLQAKPASWLVPWGLPIKPPLFLRM